MVGTIPIILLLIVIALGAAITRDRSISKFLWSIVFIIGVFVIFTGNLNSSIYLTNNSINIIRNSSINVTSTFTNNSSTTIQQNTSTATLVQPTTTNNTKEILGIVAIVILFAVWIIYEVHHSNKKGKKNGK